MVYNIFRIINECFPNKIFKNEKADINLIMLAFEFSKKSWLTKSIQGLDIEKLVFDEVKCRIKSCFEVTIDPEFPDSALEIIKFYQYSEQLNGLYTIFNSLGVFLQDKKVYFDKKIADLFPNIEDYINFLNDDNESKTDPKILDVYLIYIGQLIDAGVKLNNTIEIHYNDIKSFIKTKYSKYLTRNISKLVEIFSKEWSINSANNLQAFFNYVESLRKYKKFTENFLTDINQVLKDHSSRIDDVLKIFCNDKNDWSDKIEYRLISYLRNIDRIAQTEYFSGLEEKYNMSQELKDILHLINSQDYEGVLKFTSKRGFTKFPKELEQLKKYLKNYCDTLCLKNSDEDLFESNAITRNLQSFSNFLNYLGKEQNPEIQRISDYVPDIFNANLKLIEQVIKSRAEIAKNELKQANFLFLDRTKSHIEKVRNNLLLFIIKFEMIGIQKLIHESSETIQEYLDNLSKIEYNYINDSINFFQDIPILKNFKEKSSKILIENMENANANSYRAKVAEIKIIVEKKLEDLLVKINKKVPDIESFDSYFLEKEEINEYLIENHKLFIKNTISRLKEEKIREFNEIVPNFDNEIRSHNLPRIINFVNENVPKYEVLRPKLIRHFKEEMKNFIIELENKDFNQLEKCIEFLEKINMNLNVCRDNLKCIFKDFSFFMTTSLNNMTQEMINIFESEKRPAVISNCRKSLIFFFEAIPLFDRSESKSLIWENYSNSLFILIEELKKMFILHNSFLSSLLENEKFTEMIPLIKIYQKNESIIEFLQNNQRINLLKSCKWNHLLTFAEMIPADILNFDRISKGIHQYCNDKIKKLNSILILSHNESDFYNNYFHHLKSFKKNVEDLEASFPDFENSISHMLDSKIDNQIQQINKSAQETLNYLDSDLFNMKFDSKLFLNACECLQNFENNYDSSKEIFQNVVNTLNIKSKSIKIQLFESLNDENKFIQGLKIVKSISVSVNSFSVALHNVIDEALNEYKSILKNKGGGNLIQFIEKLKKDKLGYLILDQHSIFSDCKNLLFNLKFERKTIDQVLQDERLKSDGFEIDMGKIKQLYINFEKENIILVDRHIIKDDLHNPIVVGLLLLVESLKKNGTFFKRGAELEWHEEIILAIPDILSRLFAIYTLMNSKSSREIQDVKERNLYLFLPHCSQIISILTLLGANTEKRQQQGKVQNNFIQIGTGEGKSITLAIVSIFFSLFGFEVSCATYSKHLSERDYQSFRPLFDRLDVTQYINYSTFNKLCEKILNENGDIRELVEKNLLNQGFSVPRQNGNKRAKVLLIDELDVFFSSQFYGRTYSPATSINIVNHLDNIIKFIWDNKGKVWFNNIQNEESYKKCKNILGEFSPLLDAAIKQMISDCQVFKNHGYIVNEGMIGYKEQDAIEYDINVGYKTLFAYMHEIEDRKTILPDCKNFLKLKRLILKCGEFSYARIIKDEFKLIMGVTGTLSTLNKEMIKDLKDVYKVKKFSFMPSVYSKSKLIFEFEEHVKIIKESEFSKIILDEITLIQNTEAGKTRPIIIVFENLFLLKEFSECPDFNKYKSNFNCLTEEMNELKIKKAIDQATEFGKITLITRSFGRGTDFVIKDEEIVKNGGIHVIQTFYSSSLSEEIQIKGRAARQGDSGSYSLIIIDQTLSEFGITQNDIFNKKKKRILEDLEINRDKLNMIEHIKNRESILNADTKHNASMIFLKSLYEGNTTRIKEFLQKENQYNSSEFKTLILMDATGSMDNLLENAKESVSKMFEQANTILKKKGYPEGFLFMKLAAYRNYSSLENELLEDSPWENSPENLKIFLESIQCQGGLGNEALEIALWFANQEENINQIIILGDAGCNTKAEITRNRETFGESYWSKTKYANKTFYETELEILQKKNVIINTFYLAQRAKNDFEKIAKACNGTSNFLDLLTEQKGIKISEKSLKTLTDSVTMEILRAINPNFADDYKKTYMN